MSDGGGSKEHQSIGNCLIFSIFCSFMRQRRNQNIRVFFHSGSGGLEKIFHNLNCNPIKFLAVFSENNLNEALANNDH